MRKKNQAVVLALLLAAGVAAGCGTDSSNSGAGKQDAETHTDAGTSTEDAAGDEGASGGENAADSGGSADDAGAATNNDSDGGAEERTEVRREDYPDCDGSGHGYVEIYYSDGSMETEEY